MKIFRQDFFFSLIFLSAVTVVPMTVLSAEHIDPSIQPSIMAPDAPVSVSVGEELRLRIVATQPDGIVPAMYTEFMPETSHFMDNGDGTRTLVWRPIPRNIGVNRATIIAISAQDSTVRTTRDIDITVLPAIVTGSRLRIIAPEERPVRPAEEIAVRVVALDSSGEVPSLYITESSAGNRNITFDDNGDGSRTLRWRAPNEFSDGGALGLSFVFEFVAVAASNPTVVAIHILELPFVREDDLVQLPPDIPALLLPSIVSGVAGETITFRVSAVTPSGVVANLRVDPVQRGITFSDNGDGTRTFSWATEDTDSGEWIFTFTAEDPATGSVGDDSLVITLVSD